MDTNFLDRRSFLLLSATGAAGCLYAAFRFARSGPRSLAALSAQAGPFGMGDAAGKAGLVPAKLADGSYEISADAVEVGQSAVLAAGGIPLLLIRGEKSARIFNATCTHLGCLVRWDAASQRFLCPCHGGTYDADGKVISGPPPAALLEHKTETAGGKIRFTVA